MSNRRIGGRAFLAAIVLGFAACASGSSSSGDPFSQDPAERGEIEIKVVNLNFSDATVWALVGGGGGRQRLGTVSGKGDANFTDP